MTKTIVMALGSIALFTSVAFAETALSLDQRIEALVQEEVARKFPNENNLLNYLECSSSKTELNKLECTYEFAMYRCESGETITRWVDLSVDLSQPSSPSVQLADAVSGDCN